MFPAVVAGYVETPDYFWAFSRLFVFLAAGKTQKPKVLKSNKMTPTLFIFSGLPGVGKSALARLLAEGFGEVNFWDSYRVAARERRFR